MRFIQSRKTAPKKGFLAPQNGLGAVLGALGFYSHHKKANRLSKPTLKRLLPHVKCLNVEQDFHLHLTKAIIL